MTACPALRCARSPSAVDDARDARTPPDGSATTSSPGAHAPAATVPAKPRKSWSGRHTHCTGMRKPMSRASRCDTSTDSRCSSSVGPSYHGIAAERSQHVVALQRRQRDAGDVRDAELRGQRAVSVDDRVERRLVVADQVHLVHRQQHVADAEQRHDVAVAARLRQQALARIDQHHGQVRGRRAGGHVARVLLVARAVGDDELALARC